MFQLFAIVTASLLNSGTLFADPAKDATFSWQKTESSLALCNEDKIVWRFNYSKNEGKPYFHPLATVNGTVITDYRPKDHPWHLGLWFSWKNINHINYWEEDRKTHKSEGQTETMAIDILANDDFSASVNMQLSYHLPGKPEVMSEQRSINISAPDSNGAYVITWKSTFVATADQVVLDRTPINGEADGKPWGGYAGLSLRMNKDMKGIVFQNDQGAKLKRNPDKSKVESLGPIKWAAGSKNNIKGERVFISIIDQSNDLTQTGYWYVYSSMPFISPACLYKAGATLNKGQKLELFYSVTVSNNPITTPK